MFADIEGYTTLMQKDVELASTIIRRFQKELEEQVIAHRGTVVNFYGDGALCTFLTPIEAIRSAMKLQKNFQLDPNIPVRIGIHSGTVVQEGDKIFGDSVNLASRIESMGVVGSVLLSKKIRDDVKNHADLSLQSLGKFHFKNVEEPMEVFVVTNKGLVIPKANELKGKFAPSTKKKLSLNYLFPLFILIGLIGYFYVYNLSVKAADKIATIRNDRVAVLTFQNKTGDKELDYIGDMAAEWITRALMETKEAKIVSQNTVQSSIQLANIVPGARLFEKEKFSKAIDAKHIIRGSYYKEGDQLLLSSQVDDAITGSVQFAFEEFRGGIEKPSTLINEMKNKIAGYWMTKEQVLQSKFPPPQKEAWIEYKKGRSAWSGDKSKSGKENIAIALKHFQRAVAIDSNFILPHLHIAMSYWNLEKCPFEKRAAQISILEKKKEYMTDYERNLFQIDKYRFKQDYKSALPYAKKNYELDPLNLRDIFLYGNILMSGGSNIEEVKKIHDRLPLEVLPDNTDRKNIIMNMGQAYLSTHSYKKLSQLLQIGTYPWWETRFKGAIAISESDTVSLKKILEKINYGFRADVFIIFDLAKEAECSGKKEVANLIYQNQFRKHKKDLLQSAIWAWHLKKYEEAIKNLDKLQFKEDQYFPKSIALLYRFLSYRSLSKHRKANRVLGQLRSLQYIECNNALIRTIHLYNLALYHDKKMGFSNTYMEDDIGINHYHFHPIECL